MLDAAWVDYVFGKLTLRYGVMLARQYADLVPEAVRHDWATALDGVSAKAIEYALEHCPTDRPPNVLQFRALCRQYRPAETLPALPAPKDKVDPQRVRKIIAALEATRSAQAPNAADRVIARLLEIERERGYLGPPQRDMLERCLARTAPPAEVSQ
jgi:hypothetical protein